MEFLNTRRLTGLNLLWDKPGSVLDVRCTKDEATALLPVWQTHVREIMDSVGWTNESTIDHLMCGGISLGISAPIDALYAASEINEWARDCCQAEFGDGSMPDFDKQLESVRAAIAEEANPALLELELAARSRGVPFLWDNDEVSIGYGAGSQTWPCRQLPQPDSLDWSRYHSVPIGIVTGTNGKTTTVRLAQHILRSAGHCVGLSSTDWISVNDQIIDRGDWSGPGGARQILRQDEIDVAILETARGGLLRRGLGVSSANAAVITNLTEDHLGDFGTQNLQELLNIKWLISGAVESRGALILNADDEMLVAKSAGYSGNIVWFSVEQDNPVVTAHNRQGGIAYVLADNCLVRIEGDKKETVCDSGEIPITLAGAAKHNIANALAATALTEQLGISISEARQGLQTMSQDNNPGRSNIYTVNGVNVLVDFAHNPAAMQAVFDMARAFPAKRRLLAFGQAGDRPDDLIRECARNAWKIELDSVIVSELSVYHRGRSHGDVYEIIKDELIYCGMKSEQIMHFDEEMDSLQAALGWAQPGDLIIMLALGESAAILEKLNSENSAALV